MELYEAMKHRRTVYALNGDSPISDDRINQIIGDCLKYTPSAFHSETARVVALYGENHAALWNIVLETLRAIVPAEAFAPTEQKVAGFAAGHATLLFFEDQDTVKGLQEQFPRMRTISRCGRCRLPVWCNTRFGRRFPARAWASTFSITTPDR